MPRWKAVAATGSLAVLTFLAGPVRAGAALVAPEAQGGALDPTYLDKLLAPVALYPDQLLAQMLLCSGNSRKVGELSGWLKKNSAVKGSELQQAAEKAGFEPSFVALVPFPQVVDYMAGNLTWTSQLGGAFATDRGAVFDAIQRLRKQSQAAGNLKSTPQQTVETQTTKGGEQVIVIEPANPQVVYVPQYNPTVVYTQPVPTTVVVHEDHDDEAAAAVIGFAAGVAIGAAINNNYYYGPYGYRGGAYMYNDGWDDWYDNREDAREDYYENREDAREDMQDHREDMAGERSERAEDARENAASAPRTRSSSAPTGRKRAARPRPRRSATSGARRRRAGPRKRGAAARRSGTDLGDVRLDDVGFDRARQRRAEPDEQRSQRHALRLVLRLLERSLDAVRELARQPQPLGRRRRRPEPQAMSARTLAVAGLLLVAASGADAAGPRVFATPEEAAKALVDTVKANDLPGLVALFGQSGQDLLDTSDAATGRRNREVFVAAAAESLRLGDLGPGRKELILGNEAWPFPVPLVKGANGWSFDAAAGREEVLNRRIGRNELAVIKVLHDYVAAQRAYAATGHDGKPAGRYARRFGSDPGRRNGLYWPAQRGEPRSPLGVLVAEASEQGYKRHGGEGPSPLHGYYFRILEGQGKAAKGGAAEYVVNGEMTGGFALVAWPVHYQESGVMTFIVNQDGVGYEKDLGAETKAAVEAITRFDPAEGWRPVQAGSGRP